MPRWEERGGDVVVTFLPAMALPSSAVQTTPHETPHETPQVAPEVARLLRACEKPVSRADLQRILGLKDREHLRKAYLAPALAVGHIERTLPEKPQSRLQQYRLTMLGRTILASKTSTDARH